MHALPCIWHVAVVNRLQYDCSDQSIYKPQQHAYLLSGTHWRCWSLLKDNPSYLTEGPKAPAEVTFEVIDVHPARRLYAALFALVQGHGHP